MQRAVSSWHFLGALQEAEREKRSGAALLERAAREADELRAALRAALGEEAAAERLVRRRRPPPRFVGVTGRRSVQAPQPHAPNSAAAEMRIGDPHVHR